MLPGGSQAAATWGKQGSPAAEVQKYHPEERVECIHAGCMMLSALLSFPSDAVQPLVRGAQVRTGIK